MYRFLIKGVVQGVGFRPYIYNSCTAEGLKGQVKNIGEGVEVFVDDKERFEKILENIPPLARIDSVDIQEKNIEEPDSFQIKESEGKGFAEIPPDLYLCKECQKELKEKGNRREGYFFITCTNCGPRFTITERAPYDRDTTSMKEFFMCEKCRHEYTDPGDRRYHAQTIACNECGPKIKMYSCGEESTREDSIREAADLLKQGETVAIKGIGGFHLASKTDEKSVKRLREITGRKHKPYAVMVKDIEMAERIARVEEGQRELLESVERPIVLLEKKDSRRDDEEEAKHQESDNAREERRAERAVSSRYDVSELDTIGVMLPYTALHYLLFEHIDEPLVMTSANMPEHPISTEREEQFVKQVLDHDRKIINHADDSVIKILGEKRLFLRRSRGYVPKSIKLRRKGEGLLSSGQDEAASGEDLLALGAEMNSTFCVVKDGKAILSQYMGNTENYETFERYKKCIKRFLEMTDCRPKKIICDRHPGYNTTIYAEELAKELGAEVVKVQHHLAHAYSVAAERNINDFVAIVCDGLGYGEDGKLWGGEIFVNHSGMKNQRVGHLEGQFQLGGDSAARHPAKMLMGILYKFMTKEGMKRNLPFSDEEFEILLKQLDERYNCPITTSCGRVLDSAAVLLGFCEERTYDGRPAMLLEANSTEPYEIEPVIFEDVLMIIPLFKWLIVNMERDKKRLAATVQYYIAKGLYKIAAKYAQGRPILFSGGCAYNKILTDYLLQKGVLVNEKVPCGDGGISFGQAGHYLINQ